MAQWSTGNYRAKDGTIYSYKSSWEAIYMGELDCCSEVLSWKYEPLYVMYLDGRKIKKYLPDFLVETSDGKKIIVEIKPNRLRDSTTNCAKREAILQKCREETWEYYEWSPDSQILPSLNNKP